MKNNSSEYFYASISTTAFEAYTLQIQVHYRKSGLRCLAMIQYDTCKNAPDKHITYLGHDEDDSQEVNLELLDEDLGREEQPDDDHRVEKFDTENLIQFTSNIKENKMVTQKFLSIVECLGEEPMDLDGDSEEIMKTEEEMTRDKPSGTSTANQNHYSSKCLDSLQQNW
ncbi:hypothetical protein FQR65_LT04515 [Abscondita terminalis]|nr:hypothetical protein FQR65_LT04515 [Abscondita terminalis]